MDRSEFSAREILAGGAPEDAPVTVKGWVRTRRDSKAGISFVHLGGKDVVRHKIVQDIVEAYGRYGQQRLAADD